MTPSETPARVGILYRGDRTAAVPTPHPLFDPLAGELAARGVAAEPVIFSDDAVDAVRDELLRLDGVLVWVDPIARGESRARLDPLLREVAACGVWVSAHPDVLLAMGTKEVLFRTRSLGWGMDTRLYSSLAQLEDELPRALAEGVPRVLKQSRGNGGLGVFRVELVHPVAQPARGTAVRVQHALRGSAREDMPLGELLRRCAPYFAAGGKIVDQPLVARHTEGMVRCYVVQDRVAGFGHQRVTALMDPAPGEAAPPPPAPRIYCGPDEPEFQALKRRLESEWIPQMQRLLGIEPDQLPGLWDADFLLGPEASSGGDGYLLCEINASSVYPFPDEARAPLARIAAARLRARCLST